MSPQEVTNLWNRIIALENQKPTDYGTVIASHYQDILRLANQLNGFVTVIKNHSDQLKELNAGLDTILAQTEENRVKLQTLKPTISIWPRWK